MADIFSQKKRSEVMSRIRSRGNKATELVLAKMFRKHGITGWRRHVKIQVTSDGWQVARKTRAFVSSSVNRHPSLAVRPDFVFRKPRTAVFVDGCFWHGCPMHGTQPKGNAAFWRKKISGNQARDRLVNRALRRANWKVLRIWEHTLRRATKNRKHEARLLKRVRRALV
jgi:DNA mismatch endonuclease (patch repair protein)